jgi:hypothetical protein
VYSSWLCAGIFYGKRRSKTSDVAKIVARIVLKIAAREWISRARVSMDAPGISDFRTFFLYMWALPAQYAGASLDFEHELKSWIRKHEQT